MGSLRALLAISVVVTHSAPLLGIRFLNGDMAITCFYAISGFLMSLILDSKYRDLKKFYLNRILRIYPAYLLVVLLSLIAFATFPLTSHNAVFIFRKLLNAQNYWVAGWSIVSNFTLIGIDWVRYLTLEDEFRTFMVSFWKRGIYGGHNILAVPQAWTLAIELQFYLVAPFITRMRTWRLIVFTCALAAGKTLLLFYPPIAVLHVDPSAIFLLQLPYFLFGAVAYRGYRRFDQASIPDRLKMNTAILGLAVAGASVVFGYSLLRPYGNWAVELFYLWFALTIPLQFYATRSSKFDGIVGQFSYPIYLFHFLAAIYLYQYGNREWWGESTLLVSIVASALFIFFIDSTIQKWRKAIADSHRRPVSEVQ